MGPLKIVVHRVPCEMKTHVRGTRYKGGTNKGNAPRMYFTTSMRLVDLEEDALMIASAAAMRGRRISLYHVGL